MRKDKYDWPITPDEVNAEARKYGYKLFTILAGDPPFEDRSLAIFVPDPDDGGAAFIADGRTRYRAMRRGLEILKNTPR